MPTRMLVSFVAYFYAIQFFLLKHFSISKIRKLDSIDSLCNHYFSHNHWRQFLMLPNADLCGACSWENLQSFSTSPIRSVFKCNFFDLVNWLKLSPNQFSVFVNFSFFSKFLHQSKLYCRCFNTDKFLMVVFLQLGLSILWINFLAYTKPCCPPPMPGADDGDRPDNLRTTVAQLYLLTEDPAVAFVRDLRQNSNPCHPILGFCFFFIFSDLSKN